MYDKVFRYRRTFDLTEWRRLAAWAGATTGESESGDYCGWAPFKLAACVSAVRACGLGVRGEARRLGVHLGWALLEPQVGPGKGISPGGMLRFRIQ